jgi:hypothetical protein
MNDNESNVPGIPAPIPFRVYVGVTGHCTLENEPAIEGRVRDVLTRQIPELFAEESRGRLHASRRTPTAFAVVSALAEGADRLVAREVLKTPDGVLEAVLPLVREDYLEDFGSAASRAEFDELLHLSRRPVKLTRKTLADQFPAAELDERRRQAYEDGGRWVVDHCDVLIALWDGQPNRGRGGTAEIVAYALERKRPAIIISMLPPHGIRVEAGSGLRATALEGLELFNGFDVPPAVERSYVANLVRELFESPEGRGIPEERKRLVREGLLPFYARSSLLTKRSQKEYLRAGFWVYTLSALAVVAVAFGVVVPGLRSAAFGLESLLLAMLVLILTRAHRHNSHQKWVEGRFFTERLRSAAILASCGVEASRIQLPSHMGAAHQPDDWMVRAFDEIWRRLPLQPGCSGRSCAVEREFVGGRWLEDQRRFHESKWRHAETMSRRLEAGGRAVFVLALAAAAVHFASGLLLDAGGGHASARSAWEHVLMFLAIALPGTGAALGGIRTHREYSRLARRSSNMEIALRGLESRFLLTADPDRFEQMLREAELLFLRESQDWLTLMRFVALEPL